MSTFIDTLEAKKQLVSGGLNDDAAEAIVKILSSSGDQLATKKDLKLLESSLTLKVYTVGIAIVGVLAAMKYWG